MRNAALSLILILAACGGGSGAPDADPDRPDADPDRPDANPGAGRAVIVSGDFAAAGIVSTLDLPERTMHPAVVDGIAGQDPVIRHHGNELFVINRAGPTNITIVTADTLALVDQIGTGDGTNPQDVAVVGDKLYVAALATTGLIVIDRANANTQTTIDLSSLDPADDHPDCVSVYAVGTKVFVACGLLDDSFVPRGPGRVAVIDATTDTLVDTLVLPAANPFSLFARTPTGSIFAGDLVIGTVPSFSDFSTGCLARISVGATPAANGCALTNAQLGGYANHIEADDALMWIAATGFTPTFESFGALLGIDLETGEPWPWPVSTPDQVITDLAVCPGGIVVAADTALTGKGIRVWDNAVEVTTEPMPFGLPPAYGGNIVCVPR
jgi:hypothetical protein